MNKEEFIRRKCVADGEARTINIVGGTMFVAGLIASYGFAAWQEKHPGHVPVWTSFCLIVLLFVVAIAGAPNAYWNAKRVGRRHGLICQSCHSSLPGPFGQIAIASGNCPFCSEALFAKADNNTIRAPICVTDSDSSHRPARAAEPAGLECPATEEEFRLRQRAMQRDSRSSALLSLALFFGLWIMLVSLPGVAKTHPAMERYLADAFVLGFVAICAVTFTLGKRQDLRLRAFGMVCPACRKPFIKLAAQLVVTTGRCGHCGEQVFEKTFSPQVPSHSKPEFVQRLRTMERQQKTALLLFGPACVAILALIGASAYVAKEYPPSVSVFVLQIGIVIGVAAVGAGLFVGIRRKITPFYHFAVRCPACAGSLTSHARHIAAATGKCSYCGACIFDSDEPPAIATSPRA